MENSDSLSLSFCIPANYYKPQVQFMALTAYLNVYSWNYVGFFCQGCNSI